jgi:hypothetical protein
MENEVLGEAWDVHCYFPEWADRPASVGTPSESDHNSYMAGGYAEEFGYCAHLDCPAALPALQDDPDQCSRWRVQIGCLHPGYPECPRPLDRDQLGNAFLAGRSPRVVRSPLLTEERAMLTTEAGFRVLRVGQHNRFAAGHTGPALALWWRDWKIRRRGLNSVL